MTFELLLEYSTLQGIPSPVKKCAKSKNEAAPNERSSVGRICALIDEIVHLAMPDALLRMACLHRSFAKKSCERSSDVLTGTGTSYRFSRSFAIASKQPGTRG
jgi:hypothetical protein